MSFASISGVTLHYSLTGAPDAPPLVLINSLGTDFRIWDEVVPLLDPHYRVLRYDKRGHGLSDAPPGPYTIDDHAHDLLRLIGHCGLKRAALCGISIGGMIAARIAQLPHCDIRSLVLADTGAKIGTAEMWNDRIATVQANGMSAIADAVLGRWVTSGYRAANPAACAGWRNMLERCSPEGYVASCAAIRDANLGPGMDHIRTHTLVLVGDSDIVTPPDMAQSLAKKIGGARVRQIPNAGHVPAIEQPRALAELIREHVK